MAMRSDKTHMDMDVLRRATDRARAASNHGATCEIPPDWEPTPENIHALPEPLRRYIMFLNTRCDPAGDIQQICSLREQVKGLVRRVAELEALATRTSAPSSG
jgi:hypothetical protein